MSFYYTGFLMANRCSLAEAKARKNMLDYNNAIDVRVPSPKPIVEIERAAGFREELYVLKENGKYVGWQTGKRCVKEEE